MSNGLTQVDDAKTAMIASQYKDGVEMKAQLSSAADEKIAEKYAAVRAAFIEGDNSQWKQGDAINDLKRTYAKLRKRKLDKKHIADVLGLDVTPQRIGQVADVAKFFDEDHRYVGKFFKMYEVAYAANQKAIGTDLALTATKLAKLIKDAPDTDSLKLELNHAFNLNATGRKKYKVEISAQRVYEGDALKTYAHAVKYNGKINLGFDSESENWRDLAMDVAGRAFATAISLFCQKVQGEVNREASGKYEAKELDNDATTKWAEGEYAKRLAETLPKLLVDLRNSAVEGAVEAKTNAEVIDTVLRTAPRKKPIDMFEAEMSATAEVQS